MSNIFEKLEKFARKYLHRTGEFKDGSLSGSTIKIPTSEPAVLEDGMIWLDG